MPAGPNSCSLFMHPASLPCRVSQKRASFSLGRACAIGQVCDPFIIHLPHVLRLRCALLLPLSLLQPLSLWSHQPPVPEAVSPPPCRTTTCRQSPWNPSIVGAPRHRRPPPRTWTLTRLWGSTLASTTRCTKELLFFISVISSGGLGRAFARHHVATVVVGRAGQGLRMTSCCNGRMTHRPGKPEAD
jgi:hypothetical protein